MVIFLMLMVSKAHLVIRPVLAVFCALLCFPHFSSAQAPQPLPNPEMLGVIQAPYDGISIDAGVYNSGMAALWDLNVLDHFHYFGPKERVRGYSPGQPVAFSHVTHVQNFHMECQYCHWTVTKSPYAAVPEVRACMGCHTMLQGTLPEQQAEIARLAQYFAKGEQIPWVKVHVMPDHVHFNHKRHVKAGVACHECHGQIPNMKQVERVSSMKMGWCLSCHRERGASIDCLTCHY